MYKLSRYNIVKNSNDSTYVYNSISKGCLVLEKDSNISFLENIDDYNKLSDEEKKIMIDNGFVVEEDRNELDELIYLVQKSYYDESLLNIVLVPSLACNFKCPYCFEKNLSCGKEDVNNYFKILKKFAIKNFKKHQNVQISLFGGEPLLFIDQIFNFLDWVKKDSKKNNYKYITSIVTNGSLLNEKIINKLFDHNLLSLQITIDSYKENHDTLRIFKDGKPSFDLLIKNIKMLLDISKDKKNFQFNLRINLTNTDTKVFEEMLLNFEKKYRKRIILLIRAVYSTHAYKEDNLNNVGELEKFYNVGHSMGFKILKNTYYYQSCEGCADNKFFYLMPDLTMWKCINDIDYTSACIGKIGENGDPTIYSKNVVNWSKKALSCLVDDACLNCNMLPDCLGGCVLFSCKNNKKNCKTFDMACLPYFY